MGTGEIELPTREARGSRLRPDLPLPRVEEGEDQSFGAAYDDGVGRLVGAVEVAVKEPGDWDGRLSRGLAAALGFLAANPSTAHLILVESLAASRPARLEHERSLARLAEALRPPVALAGASPVPAEAARLLAGGLVSHLSGRVLAGEAERLAESHDLLLDYLLAGFSQAASRSAEARLAEGR